MFVDLDPQLFPERTPPLDRSGQPIHLERADAFVERCPDHDPAVGEEVWVASHLPDAVVFAVKVGLAVPQQVLLQAPRVPGLLHPGVP